MDNGQGKIVRWLVGTAALAIVLTVLIDVGMGELAGALALVIAASTAYVYLPKALAVLHL